MTLKAFRTISKKNLPNEDNRIFTIFTGHFGKRLESTQRDANLERSNLVRKFHVITHQTEKRSTLREFQIITRGTNGGRTFGSEIKVLTHLTEGGDGFVRKSSIFTHGTI